MEITKAVETLPGDTRIGLSIAQVQQKAFDPNTPKRMAKHLQEVLERAFYLRQGYNPMQSKPIASANMQFILTESELQLWVVSDSGITQR
jgi:hypothetical protein